MSDPRHQHELQAVAERYARRTGAGLYSPLRPEVWQTLQERQRVLLRLLAAHGVHDTGALRLVEVGCGSGGNLLELLRLGFAPRHLRGIELLPERHAAARAALPEAVALELGDASVARLEPGSQDLVLASTVFSSLLDRAFQHQLADAMWSWLAPGGAVLWYDVTFDNPRNPDVRGVPLPRVTLAPPLARAVCRWHPALYTAFNALPLLRTHLLAWIEKPR
jgi:SAM-dependent methyltransferase